MATHTDGSSDRLPRYDGAYKRLFTQPEMVEELLRGFLREDWAAGLDFSTLEPVSGSFIGRGLEERHGDLIWRLRWRGEEERWFYLYVFMEFQSKPDHFMAARFLSYVGLLLERIIKLEKLKAGDFFRRSCRWSPTTASRPGERRPICTACSSRSLPGCGTGFPNCAM